MLLLFSLFPDALWFIFIDFSLHFFSLSFSYFLSIQFNLGNFTLGNSEIFYYLNIYIHVGQKKIMINSNTFIF